MARYYRPHDLETVQTTFEKYATDQGANRGTLIFSVEKKILTMSLIVWTSHAVISCLKRAMAPELHYLLLTHGHWLFLPVRKDQMTRHALQRALALITKRDRLLFNGEDEFHPERSDNEQLKLFFQSIADPESYTDQQEASQSHDISQQKANIQNVVTVTQPMYEREKTLPYGPGSFETTAARLARDERSFRFSIPASRLKNLLQLLFAIRAHG